MLLGACIATYTIIYSTCVGVFTLSELVLYITYTILLPIQNFPVHTAGVWSCPATTGEKHPPCANFTFTAIDDRRAVLFGGRHGELGRMNGVNIIDLTTMVQKLFCSGNHYHCISQERDSYATEALCS